MMQAFLDAIGQDKPTPDPTWREALRNSFRQASDLAARKKIRATAAGLFTKQLKTTEDFIAQVKSEPARSLTVSQLQSEVKAVQEAYARLRAANEEFLASLSAEENTDKSLTADYTAEHEKRWREAKSELRALSDRTKLLQPQHPAITPPTTSVQQSIQSGASSFDKLSEEQEAQEDLLDDIDMNATVVNKEPEPAKQTGSADIGEGGGNGGGVNGGSR